MSMKKLVFLFVAIAMITVAAQAQVTVKGSKFTDNWSLTLKGGAVSPFQNYAFWPSARGIWGAELRKQVTSVIGLGVEGEWTVKTSSWNKQYSVWGGHSSNIFDHQLVGAFGTVNFANWFGGYKGEPRAFEVIGIYGLGWGHAFGWPSKVNQLTSIQNKKLAKSRWLQTVKIYCLTVLKARCLKPRYLVGPLSA